MTSSKRQSLEDPSSQPDSAKPDAPATSTKVRGKPRPVRPRCAVVPAGPSAMSSAPSSDFATRLERVYEHNEGAMTLPNQTHALLMRAQGDYFLLQAWIGDLVAREMTNAPRTLDKLEELTPAIAKVVKLGNVIAQFDKVIAGYGSEEEVPNPRPHWAELPPPETQSAGGRN